LKLAFVTPWYGPEAPGGAEALARSTAECLCRRGLPVEVLTTCARDIYSDWGRDYFRAGTESVNGVPVRRFPVRSHRDRQAFDAINLRLMAGATVTSADEEIFIREMINSPALIAYIRAHCADYVFLPVSYMFGTTYWGVQACPERSWVVPCLHDEAYAYLAVYQDMFAKARGVLFLSRPERDLAHRLYPIADKPAYLIGAGVDTDYAGDAAAFRRAFGIQGPFILYAGRKDAAKNLPLLIEYARRYREKQHVDLKLVLTGGGALHGEATSTD